MLLRYSLALALVLTWVLVSSCPFIGADPSDSEIESRPKKSRPELRMKPCPDPLPELGTEEFAGDVFLKTGMPVRWIRFVDPEGEEPLRGASLEFYERKLGRPGPRPTQRMALWLGTASFGLSWRPGFAATERKWSAYRFRILPVAPGLFALPREWFLHDLRAFSVKSPDVLPIICCSLRLRDESPRLVLLPRLSGEGGASRENPREVNVPNASMHVDVCSAVPGLRQRIPVALWLKREWKGDRRFATGIQGLFSSIEAQPLQMTRWIRLGTEWCEVEGRLRVPLPIGLESDDELRFTVSGELRTLDEVTIPVGSSRGATFELCVPESAYFREQSRCHGYVVENFDARLRLRLRDEAGRALVHTDVCVHSVGPMDRLWHPAHSREAPLRTDAEGYLHLPNPYGFHAGRPRPSRKLIWTADASGMPTRMALLVHRRPPGSPEDPGWSAGEDLGELRLFACDHRVASPRSGAPQLWWRGRFVTETDVPGSARLVATSGVRVFTFTNDAGGVECWSFSPRGAEERLRTEWLLPGYLPLEIDPKQDAGRTRKLQRAMIPGALKFWPRRPYHRPEDVSRPTRGLELRKWDCVNPYFELRRDGAEVEGFDPFGSMLAMPPVEAGVFSLRLRAVNGSRVLRENWRLAAGYRMHVPCPESWFTPESLGMHGHRLRLVGTEESRSEALHGGDTSALIVAVGTDQDFVRQAADDEEIVLLALPGKIDVDLYLGGGRRIPLRGLEAGPFTAELPSTEVSIERSLGPRIELELDGEWAVLARMRTTMGPVELLYSVETRALRDGAVRVVSIPEDEHRLLRYRTPRQREIRVPLTSLAPPTTNHCIEDGPAAVTVPGPGTYRLRLSLMSLDYPSDPIALPAHVDFEVTRNDDHRLRVDVQPILDALNRRLDEYESHRYPR